MTKYGYARVSTTDQNLERQIEQLKAAGVPEENIFMEKISGAKSDNRPELKKVMDKLKAGDELYIIDLSRFSRSIKDLLSLVDVMQEKKAGLKSLKESWIDTTNDNPMSKLLLTIFGGLYEFERENLLQRQREGIEIAKKKGIYEGRPKKYTEKHAGLKMAMELYEKGEYTIKQIEQITHVSKSTLYREIAKRKAEAGV